MRKLYLIVSLLLVVHTLIGQSDTLRAHRLLEEAEALMQQSKIQDAILKSQEAAMHYAELYDSVSMEVAKAKKITGIGYAMLRAPNMALPYFQEVLEIHKKILGERHLEVGNDYNNLGIAYRGLGERDIALVNFEKAVVIYKGTIKDSEQKLIAPYSNMANIYKMDYDFHKSILFRKEALRIVEKEKMGADYFKHFEIQKDIGGDYFIQLEFNKALDWYQKALVGFEEYLAPEHVNFIDLRSDLANCHCELGNFMQGAFFVSKNEEIIRKNYGMEDVRFARNYIIAGSCFLKSGQPKLAIDKYRKGLKILKTNYAELTLDLMNVYLMLGIAYAKLNDYENALLNYKSGLDLTGSSQGVGNTETYYMPCKLFLEMGRSCSMKHETSKNENDLEVARQYIDKSMAMIKKMTTNYTHESSKTFIIDHFFQVFDYAIELNLALYEIDPKPAYLEKIYELIEETNHVLLFDALREDEMLANYGVSEEQLVQKQLLEDSIAYWELESYKAEESDNHKTNDEIKGKLFDYNKKYTDLYKVLPEAIFDKKQSGIPTITEVQDHLAPDETLVEYFNGDSLLLAFVINKDHYELISLDGRDIAQLVNDFRIGIASYNPFDTQQGKVASRYHSAAISLHEKLITPIKHLLKQKLIIIPSGELNFIAFDALLEAAPTNHLDFKSYPYLIYKHEIRYTYTTKILLRKFVDQQNFENKLLAYAPTFNKAKMVASFPERSLSFAPLQFNKQEAENIAILTGGICYSGREASKENFIRNAPVTEILHLATHAKANQDALGFASIAFGNQSKEQLFAKEIYTLNLPAKLLVLSACETAIGTEIRGEGLFSLGRAFTVAGVQSIIASLWKIDDQQSAEVMTNMYENLVAGQAKSAALHQAKLNYIKQAKNALAHPSYWAAFTLHGNNDKIYFPKRNFIAWGVGLLLVSIITFLVFFFKRKK